MNNYLYKTTGTSIKSFDLEEYPDEAWTWLRGGPDTNDQIDLLTKVDWLYRAVELVMTSVADIPFYLVKPNGDEYDASDDWQNMVGFWPNPTRTIQLITGGMFSYGYAYLLREKGGAILDKDLRYLMPGSITPHIDPKIGLDYFERSMPDGSTKKFKPEKEIVYFWLPDASVETGPPKGWPAKAAFSAASVLYNMDSFTSQYFGRGAIKATLLSVPPTTKQAEAEKVKAWWKQFVQGIKSAFGANILSTDVTATIIGEGLEALSNKELTDNARQAVATAAGIPQSLLSANAANFATAEQDKKNLYDNKLIPWAQFISDTFNEQVFDELDLKLEFRPEEMDLYQQGENERAAAFKVYVDAGIKQSIAAEMLGLDLPEGVEYEDLDPEEKPIPPQLLPFTGQNQVANPAATPEPPTVEAPREAAPTPAKFDPQAVKEMIIWRSKVSKAIKRGESAASVEWIPQAIPPDVYDEIVENLKSVDTVDELAEAFMVQPPEPVSPLMEVLAELRRANDLLEATG